MTLTAADFSGVRNRLAEARWLPAHAYTDPTVWPQELERVLHREWLVVCRADQLASPGDFLAKDIAGIKALIVRGADDVIRAFHNVCRHRGMWVAEGCGRTRDFVCPYHSWTYDLQGHLLAARKMGRTTGFDPSKHGLKPIRCVDTRKVLR